MALSLYGLLLLLMALTRLIVWLYATRRPHLMFEPISRRERKVGVLIVTFPATLWLIAILVADMSPTASLAIYIGVPFLYFASLLVARGSTPAGGPEGDFA